MGWDCYALNLPEVKVITPPKFGDERGFFAETYNRPAFVDMGLDMPFVQDNHAYSAAAGTVRGLHFQVSPYAQAKLVRVIRGAIWDVAVDIRQGSPTFGCYAAAEISAANFRQILIPEGFAHGLVTLEEHTEVLYKVSNIYAPDHDKGLFWQDPALNLPWPVREKDALLSPKDQNQPLLAQLPVYFTWKGQTP